MSAPPGWHLQPDGQERYWDGTRWVERQEWVVITPGYWSSTPRQVWVPGRWTTPTSWSGPCRG